jgi:hypothetical protein
MIHILRSILVLSLACVLSACQRADQKQGGYAAVIVSAPQAGEVRRILAGEGTTVGKDAPIVEIKTFEAQQVASSKGSIDPVSQAGAGLEGAKESA